MDKQKDGTVTPQGYCIDLLKELARSLKFTFDIYLTPDGKYGAIRKNGSWNGMIGELVNEVCLASSFCSELEIDTLSIFYRVQEVQ